MKFLYLFLYRHAKLNRTCSTNWIRIWILIQVKGFDDQNWTNFQLKKMHSFWSKITIYLSLGLNKAGFRIRIRIRICINWSCWIRIRIEIADPDPDPGGKKWPTKIEKSPEFSLFLSTGCSLLRAEGFSCSLGVLYGGLGISKLKFLIKNIEIFFQF